MRLGAGGYNQIKEHPFFNGIDWTKLLNKQYESPLKQYLTSVLDKTKMTQRDSKLQTVKDDIQVKYSNEHRY
jgi:hypothetical protein